MPSMPGAALRLERRCSSGALSRMRRVALRRGGGLQQGCGGLDSAGAEALEELPGRPGSTHCYACLSDLEPTPSGEEDAGQLEVRLSAPMSHSGSSCKAENLLLPTGHACLSCACRLAWWCAARTAGGSSVMTATFMCMRCCTTALAACALLRIGPQMMVVRLAMPQSSWKVIEQSQRNMVQTHGTQLHSPARSLHAGVPKQAVLGLQDQRCSQVTGNCCGNNCGRGYG